MKTISTVLVWLEAKEGRRANVPVSDNAGNLIQFFGGT